MTPPTARGQHIGDGYVVRVARQVLDDLVVEYHGDQPGPRSLVRVAQRQAAVVVPAAATQPDAVPVHGQRRDQHHVGVADGRRAEPRFFQAEDGIRDVFL